MHSVYSAMEESLDSCRSAAVVPVWQQFGAELRRAPALATDLLEVGVTPAATAPTAATRAYVEAIHAARHHDDADGGAKLLAHLYVRYFADLFGGQALAAPTRWALGLGADSPRHYDFGDFGANRRESIEQLYAAFNAAGDALPGGEAQREAIAAEANAAFQHNIAVYSEEGALWGGAARGIANVATGYVRSRVATKSAAA